ncbi:MAG TPA: phosphohistidine phosphatase SixA [Candidatus Rubrimentiphilum sp.]|nr:phosphohistidine phosphatase SixA [Candidatus Rubrimentiphilum sp.]
MKVYFLRHGIAAEPADWKGTDYDRPLTDDGRKRMGREAKAIRELDLDLDAIVTSPLARARATAEIVASALKITTIKEDERIAGDFDISSLAEILQDHADAKALMLVGHEPSMSATIGRLIGEARVNLKKGGLACVELPDCSTMVGELLALIPPKVLLL